MAVSQCQGKGQGEFHEQLPASAHGGPPALVVREGRAAVAGGLAVLRGGGGFTVWAGPLLITILILLLLLIVRLQQAYTLRLAAPRWGAARRTQTWASTTF